MFVSRAFRIGEPEFNLIKLLDAGTTDKVAGESAIKRDDIFDDIKPFCEISPIRMMNRWFGRIGDLHELCMIRQSLVFCHGIVFG
jgi:hypothetical protein